MVPNKPLREAFLSSGITATELAWRLGYIRHRGRWVGDEAPVRRALGIHAHSTHGYPKRLQEHMGEKLALRYAEALNLDPHELGL